MLWGKKGAQFYLRISLSFELGSYVLLHKKGKSGIPHALSLCMIHGFSIVYMFPSSSPATVSLVSRKKLQP